MALNAGALPFYGPYAQQQAGAKRAYQMALAQVNQGRNSYLTQQGYTMGPGGALQVNSADPYSNYSQLQTHLGADRDRYDQAYQMGWGDLAGANAGEGIGGAQHAQFQQQEGGMRAAFAHELLQNLGNFTQARQQARTAYNDARRSNKADLLNYLVRQQKFSKGPVVK